MKKERSIKKKLVCFGLCMALAGTMLAGCGDTEETETEVMGRITSISDGEITLAVFDRPSEDGKVPGGASGGAFEGRERPEGVSGGALEGRERPDGEKPEGTPPAKNGETSEKIITITSDTKVYQQQGEEKTESSLDVLQLGSMVSVTLSGEEAQSITLQTMNRKSGTKAAK